MNYGIKGVKRKQAALNSKNKKIKTLSVVKVSLQFKTTSHTAQPQIQKGH